jgi:hypothetical protein
VSVSDLMRAHGIERIVFVPASDLLPQDAFHAWPFGEHWEPGCGATIEEAIANAVDGSERRAA